MKRVCYFFHRNPREYLRNNRNHTYLKLNSKISAVDGEIYRRIKNGEFNFKKRKRTVEIDDTQLDESKKLRNKRQKHDELDHPRQITAFMTDLGFSAECALPAHACRRRKYEMD